MDRKGREGHILFLNEEWQERSEEWEGRLALVLLTKPAEVVQEAGQVLEKHGCHVKELKSGLYYSSTLCLSMLTL